MMQAKCAAQVLDLKPGEIVAVGKRIYGRCTWCDSLVRMNKPLIGSAHICSAATRGDKP